jgi:hypothetical protein
MRPLKTFIVLVLLQLPGLAMAIEEPEFEIVAKHEGYEVRAYAPYAVAEVVVAGEFEDAGDEAFRILADYIFGNNTGDTKMSMTAPVESRVDEEGTKMAMTAPVLSTDAEEGGESYRYAFVMERKYTLESVPKPRDERITLRQIPARTVAVRRYSGFWSEANYEKNKNALIDALQRDGVRIVGKPYLARYNPPFMPWFLRRNEVIVEIDRATL